MEEEEKVMLWYYDPELGEWIEEDESFEFYTHIKTEE
jgi:hypothetical protein